MALSDEKVPIAAIRRIFYSEITQKLASGYLSQDDDDTSTKSCRSLDPTMSNSPDVAIVLISFVLAALSVTSEWASKLRFQRGPYMWDDKPTCGKRPEIYLIKRGKTSLTNFK